MKTQKLGNSELVISSMGLGMMGMSPGIYGSVDDEESIKTVHRALELGVTLLDTADTYGNGHNEELLGKALKGRRDQAVVATKFTFGPRPNAGSIWRRMPERLIFSLLLMTWRGLTRSAQMHSGDVIRVRSNKRPEVWPV